jgi:hypothetical protein
LARRGLLRGHVLHGRVNEVGRDSFEVAAGCAMMTGAFYDIV